jgi:hypothetical protein
VPGRLRRVGGSRLAIEHPNIGASSPAGGACLLLIFSLGPLIVIAIANGFPIRPSNSAMCGSVLTAARCAQHHIRVGPVLRIEERRAADCDRRIGLGDLAELHADVAFARKRTVSESMRTPIWS